MPSCARSGGGRSSSRWPGPPRGDPLTATYSLPPGPRRMPRGRFPTGMRATTASFSITATSSDASLLTYTRYGEASSNAARITIAPALSPKDRSCQCRRRSMLRAMLTFLAVLLAASSLDGLDQMYPQLDALYLELHKNPELAMKEQRTSARMAEELRKLGYEVTTGVGGTGVVGVLRNGKGPTALLRTELDALPVEVKTGLPFASTATAVNTAGQTVPVMHACGHDAHMAAWTGAAALLARAKDRWRGTVLMIGQPGEETVQGAKAMIADGLFSRFPKADFSVAVHDSSDLPAGKAYVVPGFALASVDSVDVTIFGRGGHGAKPNTTIDPVVIAARAGLAVQTLVSRQKDPLEPAVRTAGSIHRRPQDHIIPHQVKPQVTVRTHKPEVLKLLLERI